MEAVSLCNKCGNVHLYEIDHLRLPRIVSPTTLKTLNWCHNCEKVGCTVCVISRFKKPIGFSKRCQLCPHKFVCASLDIKHLDKALVSIMHITINFVEGSTTN